MLLLLICLSAFTKLCRCYILHAPILLPTHALIKYAMAAIVISVPIMVHLPYDLSLNIDPQVTSQVFIRIITFEVALAGIHISLVIVIPVILYFVFSHFITSNSNRFISFCLKLI